MNKTSRRAGVAMIVAAALALAGCVTVQHTVLMDRSAQPVPPDEVQILLEDDPVPALSSTL